MVRRPQLALRFAHPCPYGLRMKTIVRRGILDFEVVSPHAAAEFNLGQLLHLQSPDGDGQYHVRQKIQKPYGLVYEISETDPEPSPGEAEGPVGYPFPTDPEAETRRLRKRCERLGLDSAPLSDATSRTQNEDLRTRIWTAEHA